jgi:hypothetical protein
MEDRQAHVGKMETRLKKWGAKLDELVAKADGAGADAKVDTLKRIDDLKAKHQVAQARLDELRTTSGEKWETVKTGVERAWNDLEAAFEKLTN